MKKKKLTLFLNALLCIFAFSFASCSNDDEEKDDSGINYNEFKIVNNGNGAVTSITDTEDSEALEIVQTIPSFSNILPATKALNQRERQYGYVSAQTRAANDGVFPANLPIMFFFNDKILLSSIVDNLIIVADGTEVKGTVVINEGANGYAILTFTPWKEFKVNKSISATIKKGIQDDGGNEMLADLVLSYTTNQPGTGNFDNNKGFENGEEGVAVLGDGSVLSGKTGDLTPQSGNCFAAISSGDQLVSAHGYAIGEASSLLILGPINKEISTLSFYYDFISAEFDDYVDSEFDDCAMITVSGPKGAYSAFITSVNTIRFDNQVFTYPGMPDDGDEKAGHIGWTQKTMNIPSIGVPAYITFTVTDVSDHILSSILAVDNLNY